MRFGKLPAARFGMACLLALLSALPAAAQEGPDQDEELLHGVGVATDGPGLLAFLRERTLTEADHKRLEALVVQLGDRSFKVREQASRTLTALGPPALSFLRRALNARDLETVRRAQRSIAEIEHGPGPAVPAAVLRLLARQRPEGAVAVSLAYAPFVDDDSVEDTLLESLGVLGVRQGTVDAALVAALDDRAAARRLAAGYVVGRFGSSAERDAAKKLLQDRDANVRLRTAEGLIAAREKAAVATLVALLSEGPVAVARVAEEKLFQLAGDQAPRESLGTGAAAARQKCREAWSAWWQGHAAAIDLARLEDGERLLGLTLLAEPFSQRVWECGPDGRPRWQLTGLQGPWDAQALPGGHVLVAEYQGQRVTERDTDGRVVWEKHLSGTPNGCQRLPNGHTLITTNQTILEVDRQGREVDSHTPGENLYIVGAMKDRSGRIVCGTSEGVVVFRHDARGWKRTRVGTITTWCRAEGLSGGRVLAAVPSEDRVLELDAAGAVLASWVVPGAASAVRLPNGHTLVACSRANRVVELDRSGKTVWEKAGDGQPWRVRRR